MIHFVLSIIYNECDNEEQKVLKKEESIEIIKVIALIII